MILSLIAAVDRQGAIGAGNALPWHLPADLARFKAITLGKPVLMGRKTAESIGCALPGRQNLVLTRGNTVPFPGQQRVGSVDEAIRCAQATGAAELCVIGGAEVYALTLPVATRLRLAHVDAQVPNADAFFPPVDPHHWTPVDQGRQEQDARHAFGVHFMDYDRR